MSFGCKPLGGVLRIAIVFSCFAVVLAGSTARAQLPELWVRVSDTTASSGEQNTVISVYLNNYQDTVAGFNLWIQLDRPDIMEFQTDSGLAITTTCWECVAWDGGVCVDSIITCDTCNPYVCYVDTFDVLIGNVDTTGTLCSGWEMVDARSLGAGFDLNIAGIANGDHQDGHDTPGFGPQQGGLLVKVLADVFEIPDSMTDRTVNMMIQHDILDHYNFSRPDGSSIGIVYQPVEDTNCWVCHSWVGDQCLVWERVSLPPPSGCDSIEVHPDSLPRVDSNTVTLLDGSLTVESFVCGNVDGGSDGAINVADLTYMVSYLFQGGAAPVPEAAGDMDCVPGVNVADLTYLVAYLFQGGAEPCAGC